MIQKLTAAQLAARPFRRAWRPITSEIAAGPRSCIFATAAIGMLADWNQKTAANAANRIPPNWHQTTMVLKLPPLWHAVH